MASARQVAANRRNASLPRGPLSDAACAAIRENAVKHGLTAKHVVLAHEDYADYQELRASIVMEYQPDTPQEHRLADQIAQNYWRLLRSRRVETATFENRLGTLKDRLKIDNKITTHDDQGISICMANDGRNFDTLRRYETSIERAWYRHPGTPHLSKGAPRNRRRPNRFHHAIVGCQSIIRAANVRERSRTPRQSQGVRNWDWLRFAKSQSCLHLSRRR
jgi:hypothetical protein